MGTALGHPHDRVRGSTSTQSGAAQVLQMLLVRVTVGQPDCCCCCCWEAALEGPGAASEEMLLEAVVVGVWAAAVTVLLPGRVLL